MKYCVCIYLIIFLFSCNIKSKDSNIPLMKTAADTMSTVGDSSKTESYPIIDLDSLRLEDFKRIFLKEAEKWDISFVLNADKTQLSADNLGIGKHERLESWNRLSFSQLKENNTCVVEYHSFSNGMISDAILNDFCENYYDNLKTVTGFIEGGNPFPGQTYYAVCFGRTIFQFIATSDISHILTNAIDTFKKENAVDKSRVIPCQWDFISPQLVRRLQPHLSEWLKMSNLNLYHFRCINYEKQKEPEVFNMEQDSTSMYFREYGKENDVYIPQLHDYSPNKQRYVTTRASAGVYKDEDGKYYYMGGDDCQELYLVDRKKQRQDLILWLGAGGFAEAAFWIDNNTFAIVGEENDDFYIRLYGRDSGYFAHRIKERISDDNYFSKSLKLRGIISDE